MREREKRSKITEKEKMEDGKEINPNISGKQTSTN